MVKRIVICGMLVAIGVVLGGVLKIPVTLFGAYALKISFGVAPVIVAAVLFGPVYGGICGGLCDLLGAFLFPVGGYNPVFTLVGVSLGVVPSLFFLRVRRVTYPRLLAAIFVSQAINSVIVNTLLLIFIYSLPVTLFIPRALTQAIMIPALSAICFAVLKGMEKIGYAPDFRREPDPLAGG